MQLIVAIVMSLFLVGAVDSREIKKWKLLSSERGSHGPYLVGLQFISPDYGWAIMPAGLLKTIDGGRTWEVTLRSGLPGKVFSSFAFADEKTGWIVGARSEGNRDFPLILGTRDGGESWFSQAVQPGNESSGSWRHGLSDVQFHNSQEGWAVGQALIVHTANGGEIWEAQRSGQHQEWLFSLAVVDARRIWAVGEDGLILHSSNGGKTWIRQESRTKNSLLRVRFFNGQGWIVGSSGTILYTSNDGNTWIPLKLGLREDLRDIYVDDSEGWIVGTRGIILHTVNSGKTWRQQKSQTLNDLLCLSFIDSQNGWASGDKLTLLRLSN